MTTYSEIMIIYNPNSTGRSEEMARSFKKSLHVRMPHQKITLVKTEYAGHAEELGYMLSKSSSRPLIISVSGDGGYHEVINGIMKAQHEGAHPVSGLLPAGNANDHYNALHDKETEELIVHGKDRRIDVLKLTVTDNQGAVVQRYAHSYIGVGLTPKVGHELNRTVLNWFNQLWIVARVLFTFRPTRLVIDGKLHSYDSLIFSNIERMSKVMTLSKEASVNDNQFEVNIFRRRNKLQLIHLLLRASLVGLESDRQTRAFAFETYKSTLVQLDGEVLGVGSRSRVEITLEHNALRCIV